MTAIEEAPAVAWDGMANSYLPPSGPLAPMPVPYWDETESTDPITFEVIRHQLYGVVEEQGLTIQKVSGSPVATFAHDFASTLLTADAEPVYFGPFNQPQIGALDQTIKWVLEHRSSSPGIADGDMYLSNDPWIGAQHQSDVAIACPVFWEGRLLCWVGSTMHVSDIGGSTPGGFCPDAESVYDEPLPTPPVKYVEDWEIRRDTEDMFLRRSRTPDLLRLDLRALIASNHVARERVLELVERFGASVVVGCMQKVIDDAERAFVERLRALPDGEWSETTYIEIAGPGDRDVYPVVVTLVKADDKLVFRNDGTHPQTGAISTTVGGWRGGTLSVLNPVLGYDLMHASGGILRRVFFEPVPDTLLSASYPASVSNPQAGVSATMAVTTVVVSKMLAASADPDLRGRAMAAGSSPYPVSIVSGSGRDGQPYGSLFLDAMGGGFGAFSFRDGEHTGGMIWDPIATMPNVEFVEQYFPVLYLYRRERPDSGGAGAYRGGNSGVLAVTPHKIPELTLDVSSAGWAVPQASGIFGGRPGCTNGARFVKSSALRERIAAGAVPQDLEQIGGDLQDIAPKLRTLAAREGDVFELWWAGGGGLGDPRTRDPEQVQLDVRRRAISAAVAEHVYGVVLGADGVDREATAALRGGLTAADGAPVMRRDDAGETWLCPSCSTALGPNEGDGRHIEATTTHELGLEQLTPLNRPPELFVDPQVGFRVHACPECGVHVDGYVWREGPLAPRSSWVV
jgi:N-methylhydantoinase B